MPILAFIGRLLRNNAFILALAYALGLAFGQLAAFTESTVTPALGLVMTFSILGIPVRTLLDFKKLVLPIIVSLFHNYVLLSVTFLGLSALIVSDPEVHTGFVLVAAVPLAIAVIPFTYHLGGDTAFSLVGTVAAYLAALIITPLMCILLLGTSFIEPGRLVITLVELIIAPILISRLLRWTGIAALLERYRRHVVNWGFFLIVYTIVGLNRFAFLGQPETLLPVCAVAFGGIFILSEVIERLTKLLGVDDRLRVSLMLLGTRKTWGLAAAIGLSFFGARTAVPAAVASGFAIAHFVWLNLSKKSVRERRDQRVQRRHGKQTAAIALARKLLVIAYFVLKGGSPYGEKRG